MSKQVKDLITKELADRFKDLDGVGVINPRGINAIKNNLIRRRLHEKGLKMTVVKNTLARRATDGAKLKGFDKLLDGPSAVVYGKAASISLVARLLLDEKKADDTIELRGMFFDGELYLGHKGVEQVSKLPTREEAIGNLVGLILGPGSKLAGALKGPGGKLGALLKAIEEKAAAAPQAAPEAAPAAGAAPAADAAPAAGAAPTA
ncbi:MAG: rplJ [Phycisphaerales bacterium]|jgi:large subunit ribosomal protein L10|nr:rplJ [Phycisphaerales bacterium]MDB5300078.1 rplJ [Phycisphaerales bacterium]